MDVKDLETDSLKTLGASTLMRSFSVSPCLPVSPSVPVLPCVPKPYFEDHCSRVDWGDSVL